MRFGEGGEVFASRFFTDRELMGVDPLRGRGAWRYYSSCAPLGALVGGT
ncbi:MAG: hypothetical protein QXW77_01695 [Candidatus Hadarchaeales archaeon]